jgi:two-component system sensor kinase FixL
LNIAGRNCLLGIGYVVAYIALDDLSFVQPLLKLGITPWNPDAGLTLAFLLLCGWRQAIWTAVAAILAELLVRGAPVSLPALLCSSAVIAIGYGAFAFVLSKHGLDLLLASRRAVLEFGLGSAVTAFVIASAYAATLIVFGVLPVALTSHAIARNWIGDTNGILTLTPLLLAAPAVKRAWPALRAHRGLIASQALVLAASLWLVFWRGPAAHVSFIYVLFAPVVWITLAWGVPGASLATLLIQIGFMTGLAPQLSAASTIEIQYFLVTLVFTALLLGAVLAERADALDRMRISEAEQRALLTTAPDAVLTTNLAGQITSANIAAERLLRASSSEMCGTPLAGWLPELFLIQPVARRRLNGTRANGERFPVEIACVLLDAPARPGYLLIARDMSEYEHAQAQLRERETALASAMRFALAGELSTALTHELNQPMTAIVSYLKAVEILAAPFDSRDPRLTETVHKATREALRAADILKRLRDFYRAGAVHVAAVDVEKLIADVACSFADRAERLGVHLTQEIRVTQEIAADRVQLQMVLYNLMANALDAVAEVATEGRRVHMRAVTDGDQLRVTLEDSGRGVPSDVLKQLFEPFVTSKTDGMGLGLAISRSLLRSQGGELRLDISSAAGARFLVELPVSARERPAA